MNYTRPTIDQIAERAVAIARAVVREINEHDTDPGATAEMASREQSIIIGAIVADAIADVDESLVHVREALDRLCDVTEGR